MDPFIRLLPHEADIRVILARFKALRSIGIIAVVALYAGSVLMFLSGAFHTIDTPQAFIFGRRIIALPGHMNKNAAALIALIQAVDAIRFAFVLLIFSYGVYTLFINREVDATVKLPQWLHIENISQLKTALL